MKSCCFVLLLFAWLNAIDGQTVSVQPTMDAFVTTGPTGNLSTNNYGAAGALSVAAPGLSQGEFQSVLQFDLSGAKNNFDTLFGPGQWHAQTLTLQLTAASPNNGIFNASAAGQFNVIWMQNDSWSEGPGTPNTPSTLGVTYSSLQTIVAPADEPMGTFNFAGGTSGSATYNLTLPSGFLSDLANGGLLSLRMTAADTTVSYLFDSRNFPTASSRPVLTIQAVPEPSSAVLCALGGLALLGRTHRRKSRAVR